ncbi:trypsin-like serine protease [Aquella oligotrophica]|nr:trypsin-like serine protease [Aquella oligotrophica]
MMNKKLLQLALLSSVGLTVAACNSGSSSPSPAPTPTPTPSPTPAPSPGPSAQAIPASYQCLPSNLPTASSVANSLKIAYAGNCSVASAPQSTDLQKMAVALETYKSKNTKYPESGFYNNCTGTPIQYNPTTGVTFIVTAAHCVIGTTTPKAAGAPTTAANIGTYVVDDFGHNDAWIYQGTNAGPLQPTNLTAQILAVYVPSQYCQQAAYTKNDGGTYDCNTSVRSWNGDFAILKVQAQTGKTVDIAPNLKLAPSNFSMIESSTRLLALGYGGTNPNNGTPANPENTNLNYINYQYFATNKEAETTIMNGWFQNNKVYSLICPGDSGGGDFAWDGTNWNLVGVHSWGPIGCGIVGMDWSADVRQFNSWINTVLTQDTQATGCANLGSNYACASGTGK